MKRFLIFLISIYQKTLSAFFGGECRFYPSCSEYSKQAIRKKGILHGLGNAFYRIVRCHPFHPGGYDPVE